MSASGSTGIWSALHPSGASSATRPGLRWPSAPPCSMASLPTTRAGMTRPMRHLRQAVELDDNLSYTEPWAWMHPPRHALAALLLDQGHARGSRAGLSRRSRLERQGAALRAAPEQCLGAAWAGGMPEAARRDRRIGGAAREARHGAGQGGRADHLVVPVPDQRAIRTKLLSLRCRRDHLSHLQRRPTGRTTNVAPWTGLMFRPITMRCSAANLSYEKISASSSTLVPSLT